MNYLWEVWFKPQWQCTAADGFLMFAEVAIAGLAIALIFAFWPERRRR